MKKTLITLLALAGVSMGTTPMYWESSGEYDLSDQTTISATTIGNTSGYIITKTNGENSPAVCALTFNFTIESFGTIDQNLLTFSADDGGTANAYGFVIKSTGVLEFGRANSNQIKSTTNTVHTNDTAVIQQLSTNTNYQLTLQSFATLNDAGEPGRGSNNFSITLTNLTDPTAAVVTKTAKGFAMNGSEFKNMYIGTNVTAGAMQGTVSSIVLSVPEPTTATLSLLALAGLAARRRRK